MTRLGAWLCLAGLLVCAPLAQGQTLAEYTADIGGESLRYAIRTFAPGVHLADPAADLEPTSTLNTARLLNRYLTAGKVEDAALLSNAPRRRFEVLREYERSVGEENFRKVYAEYFNPQNRLVAEVVMGSHSLLVWRLREGERYSGQYYVQVEGKVLMDDVPSEARLRLRRILEAVRAGKLALPAQR